MPRQALPLVLLLLLVAPILAQAAAAQQVASINLNIEKSDMRVKVYPDGSIKLIYALKAAVTLPPGSLKDSKVDIRLSYNSSYKEKSSSSDLVLSGAIESPSMDTGKGRLYISLDAGASQKNTHIEAMLTGTIVFQNETKTITIRINNFTIRADNASKAFFHVEIEAKGIRPSGETSQKTPSIADINKMLAKNGIDYVEVKSLGVILEEGNKTKIVISGVIDIDKMLADAVAAGMPSTDAAKLRKLLETSLNLDSRLKLVVKAEAETGHRIVFDVSYNSRTSGDIEKAEEVSKKAAPLVNELVTALMRRVAQATGNQELMQVLLLGSMTSAGQTSLPVVNAPPTRSSAEVHIYSNDDKITISIYYEGPRQKITPSSGNPSTDAQKILTLLSAQLVQLRSQLARLGLVLPGAENLVPSKVAVEPATSNVKVSKNVASLAELPALKIEITKTGTQTAITPPSTPPAKTTSTTTTHITTTSTTTRSTTTTSTTTQTKSAKSTTSTASANPAQATTTKTGASNKIVVGGIVVAVIAIVAAIIISRKR